MLSDQFAATSFGAHRPIRRLYTEPRMFLPDQLLVGRPAWRCTSRTPPGGGLEERLRKHGTGLAAGRSAQTTPLGWGRECSLVLAHRAVVRGRPDSALAGRERQCRQEDQYGDFGARWGAPGLVGWRLALVAGHGLPGRDGTP